MSGGAMLLYGLKESTTDVDMISFSSEAQAALEPKAQTVKIVSGNKVYTFDDDAVELGHSPQFLARIDVKDPSYFTSVYGIKLLSIKGLKVWYEYLAEVLNREKDHTHLAMVENAIAKL